LPLAALLLTAGVWQQEREAGTWRWIRAQTKGSALALVARRLVLQFAALWSLAALSSAIAFVLDPAGDLQVCLSWLLAVGAFTAFWVVVGAVMSLPRMSSAGAIVAAFSVWLALTFGTASVLGWWSEREVIMPSRLTAIVTLRATQQAAEDGEAKLLAGWYETHPDDRPAQPVTPETFTWPVTFLPRHAVEAAAVRPVLEQLNAVRSQREFLVRRWAWISPALALMLYGDQLAGVDAMRLQQYGNSVDQYEDRWRSFFATRIMAYRGLTRADAEQLNLLNGAAPDKVFVGGRAEP
jgi:ABC-2 type transport system permease protein